MKAPPVVRPSYRSVFLFVVVALSLLGAGATFTGVQASASTKPHSLPSCGWKVISSPKVTEAESYRFSGFRSPLEVAAISRRDVWIAGTFIEHWNGSKWAVNTSLRPPMAIAAASAKDIWVVGGDDGVAYGDSGSFMDHWNGRGWTPVSHVPITAYLSAVGFAPNHHVWAAGGKASGDGDYEAYVVHWNGHRWVGVVPPLSDQDPLTGIAPISPTDVLIVGDNGYAAQWNGKRWTVLPFATLEPPAYFAPQGIAAISATDAWAVGGSDAGAIEHWNGASWSVAPFMLPGGWASAVCQCLGGSSRRRVGRRRDVPS